ncbi:MAG: hypothetical protein KME40_18005 [Komarekiella atlantica HA4396-MV6]|nr:hypothetical protein [Komarekiella atlantica HA4396-MV6]
MTKRKVVACFPTERYANPQGAPDRGEQTPVTLCIATATLTHKSLNPFLCNWLNFVRQATVRLCRPCGLAFALQPFGHPTAGVPEASPRRGKTGQMTNN